MNLAIENTSLNESVKKVTVESVEVKKQLEMVWADPMAQRTLSAQKEDHLEKMKIEMEEAVKNFTVSKGYLNRLMVEYADDFELPQKYFVKYHPNWNFSLLDMEEIEKEMLTMEAEANNIVAEDAMVDAAENITRH